MAATTAGPNGDEIRTGNAAHHSPAGWAVYIDTSWDRRGHHVAAREGDIEIVSRAGPSSLGRVLVRPGRPYLLDGDVLALLTAAHGPAARKNHWLGLSWMGRPVVQTSALIEVTTHG